MRINISATRDEMGRRAAALAAEGIRAALRNNGQCNLILATGASQFQMLEHLVAETGIDWGCVVLFHLDEYIGLPISHPASFRRYMYDRVVSRLPGLAEFCPVQGDAADLNAELRRLNERIARAPVDVACIGIGENGHLAFNDPPADFDTELPYIAVDLDTTCRKQQMGEGWFPDIDSVPARAITMSIRQILKSRRIVVTVPDSRKAEAVRNTLTQPVSPAFPSTVLRQHEDCTLFIDMPAAELLPSQLTDKE